MSEPLSPDWVITGAPHGEGVRLIASKNMMPGGALRVIEKEELMRIPGVREHVRTWAHDHWAITMLAEDVVIVDAHDYPSALRILLANWSVPEPAEPVREIFTTREAITAAEVASGIDDWPTAEDAIAEINRTIAIIDEVAAAFRPMDPAERALIEGVLEEEP